jgi:hypothetical protein
VQIEQRAKRALVLRRAAQNEISKRAESGQSSEGDSAKAVEDPGLRDHPCV